ncbi:hypothetical protein ABEW60_05375 [Paenibacillus jamilae]|uniref:hypothetical protein n=1 Tax=Paenibacillus jamilae TaxID=114136 RepID=UPI003D26C3CE
MIILPKKVNNRPIKYSKRNKTKNRIHYFVSSLVPEITGLTESNIGFSAAKKEVQRIVKTMKEFGNSTGTLKVSPESKDGMIFLTKELIFTGNTRPIYKKIRSNEELSEEEENQLIKLFKEAVKFNKDGSEKELLLRRTTAEEEFSTLSNEIMEIISNDLNLADTIFYYDNRVEALRRYRDLLVTSMENWRNEVNDILLSESILIRLKNCMTGGQAH